MPRYKPVERHSLLLPVELSEQVVPGSFAFALDYLVDSELGLSPLDARFNNDEVGASAYDPRVMLKVVLLAYSQGLISSRTIERACERNVQFIAISGDSRPSHAHIAKFVSTLGEQIKALFGQVLMTCDCQGLIGKEMFAIDGANLPSNASKERSGSDANVQQLMDKGIPALIADNQMRQRDERLQGQGKYKGEADPLYDKRTAAQGKPVKRFGPKDFRFNDDNTGTCPTGKTITSFGTWYMTTSGQRYQLFEATDQDCQACGLRGQCLKDPSRLCARQVTRYEPKVRSAQDASERMRRAIDSTHGRHLCSQRIGTVEPVFGNIRPNKNLSRLNLRGREKVNTQWHLYCMCMVHNIEKLANSGWRQ